MTTAQDVRAQLTTRQYECVELASRGLTNKQIGNSLRITEAMVKIHLGKAFKQLGISRRTQLVCIMLTAPPTVKSSYPADSTVALTAASLDAKYARGEITRNTVFSKVVPGSILEKTLDLLVEGKSDLEISHIVGLTPTQCHYDIQLMMDTAVCFNRTQLVRAWVRWKSQQPESAGYSPPCSNSSACALPSS